VRFDYEMAVDDGPDGTVLRLEYDTGLFSEPEARALCREYLGLLARVLDGFGDTVADVVADVSSTVATPELSPDESRPAAGVPVASPPTLAVLGALWAELLGRDDVAADDDFFAVGGYSMLASRLVARTRTELGVEITLAEFFDNSTLGGLAALVDGKRRATLEGLIDEMTDEEVAARLAQLRGRQL
jgi:hypothetical protein